MTDDDMTPPVPVPYATFADEVPTAPELPPGHPSNLVWAGRWPWSARCRAFRERRPFWAIGRPCPGAEPFGRCELRPHTDAVAHALERGSFDAPYRWRTDWERE